jgi:hypothetical protein
MAAVVLVEEPSWLALVAVVVFVATPFILYFIFAHFDQH